MKKILLLLLCFSFTSIKAYNYTEWSTEYPDDVDKKFIESEVRYRWFKENIINIEYLIKESIGEKIYDSTDFKYSDYSEESIYEPDMKEEREIISETKLYTFSNTDIDYIKLRDFVFISNVYIYEIDIKDKNRNIIVDYEFGNVLNNDLDPTILNDNLFEDYVTTSRSMNVLMNLNKKYNVSDLEVIIHYKSVTSGYKYLTLAFNAGPDNEIFYGRLSLGDCPSGCSISLEYDSDVFSSNLEKTITLFKYRDKLYKTYVIQKEYVEGYFTEYDGYIKDVNDSVTYYRYIDDCLVIYNIKGELMDEGDPYCYKNFCFSEYVKRKDKISKISEVSEVSEISHIEINPKTSDDIYKYLNIILVCVFFLIIIIKIIVDKCHMNK